MQRSYVVRFLDLLIGQVLSALGVVFMLRAHIGLEPWSVLHQGLANTFQTSYGRMAMLVGVAVVFLALLLGESFGLGTLVNVFLCPYLIDVFLELSFLPVAQGTVSAILFLLIGMEILSLGTLAYLKSALGAGPRDAFMVALARKAHFSTGLCRIGIDATVTLLGWLLTGPVGIGTLLAAFGYGSLLQINFSLFRFDPKQIAQENLADTWRRLRKRH